MIEIDLLLLKIKDELSNNEEVIAYKRLEQEILDDYSLRSKISRLNDLIDEYNKYQDAITNEKIKELTLVIESNCLYKEYLRRQEMLGQEIYQISRLVFKDIINVGEKSNECSKR